MIEQDYRKLMREVYIDSLRSVLIVDDDFPTQDELLAEYFTPVYPQSYFA